jgi:hypothetical protein
LRSWPAVRAALITLALVVGLIEGLPAGDAHLARLARVQRGMLSPFRFIGDGLHITQHWKLFPVANPDRFRMWIEARTAPDAAWQLLYRPHDDAHTWLADALEYRRMRGAWNPGTRHVRGAYPSFVTWVAGTTFVRDPRWQALRVRMEVLDIDPRRAGDPTGATGRFVFEEVRARPVTRPPRTLPPAATLPSPTEVPR